MENKICWYTRRVSQDEQKRIKNNKTTKNEQHEQDEQQTKKTNKNKNTRKATSACFYGKFIHSYRFYILLCKLFLSLRCILRCPRIYDLCWNFGFLCAQTYL